ncbi:MAG: hypothetical protein R3F11_26995 [Verrucomicrobiales bacterium]
MADPPYPRRRSGGTQPARGSSANIAEPSSSGSEDRHAGPAELSDLFGIKGPKEFWVIEGAAHIDLHRFAGLAYERRVTEFLARHLPPPGESAR